MTSGTLVSTLTHSETAWAVAFVPIGLTIGTLLLLTLLMRGPAQGALHAMLQWWVQRDHTGEVAPSLRWAAPIISAGHLLACCLGAGVSVLVLLDRLVPLMFALVLAGPMTALLIWLLLRIAEQRYQTMLDRALPAAVGRLGAYLRGGSGIQPALARVVADLPLGPLRMEWSFLLDALGTPLAGGRVATPQQVVAALAFQTPSRRHATVLEHLEGALGQTHDVLTRRVQAAARALAVVEQRRSQAATELAQMRYSGVVIGGTSAVLAGYLALTQWERMQRAYSGPLGVIAGVLVGLAMLAPIVGGVLLARADDLEY